MDIPEEFQKIRIFFTDDGFVSILKEVPDALMAFIESNCISSHKAAHDLAQRCLAGAEEEVKMPARHREPEISMNPSDS